MNKIKVAYGERTLSQLFMKGTLLLPLILFVFIGLTNAQKPEIAGSCLLKSVEVDGEVQQAYLVSELQEIKTVD